MSSQPAASNANPLPASRTALLDQLTAELDAPALWWLSGYTAGLAQRHAPALALVRPAEASVPAPTPITVLFGSQTGNAKRLAEAIATRIDGSGRAVRLLRADAYRLRELSTERHLLIVVSTQGDGDAPDDARDFIDHLLGKRAPKLPDLKFAVLGLGDSSYPKFCEIGRRLDARLVELGASRWLERADADLDIDTVATPWLERIIALAATLDAANPPAHASAPSATITPLRPPAATPTFSREHPFAAELLIDQRITARDSERDVRHIELSLQDSGLTYEPGDALGVWPTQAPALVDGVLDALQLDGDAGVAHGGQTLPLRDWLTQHRELTRLNRSFIVEHAQRADDDATLQRLLGEDAREDLARALNDWQLIDLLQRHRAPWSAADLVGTLRPLQPRLYSIASSMNEVGQQAHLTVAHATWQRDGAPRHGVASHHLATSGQDAKLRVFIERNAHFRLPVDGDRDLIMIGAGAGIAPFRGFVQERTANGARGRHWLLFGNRHARSDFLYQLEWQRALKDGSLHRLDVAFSRDAPRADGSKPYVQTRIRQHGRQLLAWLQAGAHLYVCGAVAMGKDVHAALLDALDTHAGMDREAAEDYLRDLQRQGRYAKDVY